MSSQLSLKLLKIVRLNVELTTKTGLLISGGRVMGRIGGSDIEPMSVEKEYACDGDQDKKMTQDKKITVRVPYIPGSSLKGRMRSLLEVALGLPLYSSDRKIWAHIMARGIFKDLAGTRITDEEFVKALKDTPLDRLFGYGAFPMRELQDDLKNKHELAELLKVLTPTALLVEDLFPSKGYVCDIYKRNGLVTFDDFIEDKGENRIDRVTSAADPREVSRVKPGVPFTGTISLLVFDKNANSVKEFLNLLTKGMSLLEKTYLGAYGSRGYGRVEFTSIDVSVYDPQADKETKLKEKPLNSVEELAKEIDNLVKLVTQQS